MIDFSGNVQIKGVHCSICNCSIEIGEFFRRRRNEIFCNDCNKKQNK